MNSVGLINPFEVLKKNENLEISSKIPKLKLWTPNNGHLGIQSFSFGRVSGWALSSGIFVTSAKIFFN